MYQYCSSHHAGDTRSVTESAFFGGVRNRSSGDRVSGAEGFAGGGSREICVSLFISLLTRRLSVSQICQYAAMYVLLTVRVVAILN